MNYYNEFDPKAAAWLRELIKEGHIPAGDVDERSITDVKSHELTRYAQCHFFAGIGGWPYALRLAGWPDERPVWTGSCPCQPFSAAGKQEGQADSRHLWPAFFGLIRECRPDAVFGEQVESAIGHGWLDGVQSDLEGEGYAVGHCVLGAHSAGAPHIRQRLYWVADAEGEREGAIGGGARKGLLQSHGDGPTGRLALTHGRDTGTEREQRGGQYGQRQEDSGTGGLVDGEFAGLEGHAWNEPVRRESGWVLTRADRPASPAGPVDGMDDRDSARLHRAEQGPESDSRDEARLRGTGKPGDHRGFWDAFEVALGTDGKARRIESGTFPLAHGIPGRVGLLRGYGNAIVPQVAAAFIQASEQARADCTRAPAAPPPLSGGRVRRYLEET